MKRILLYIEQQPHFAQRLKPVPGLITADQVREAKADWAVFCAKALRRYEQIYQGRKGWTADKIDHALPVVGILRSKRPQEALNCIFEVLVGHLAALPK